MLVQLTIQNFAIIERVELNFQQGFTVITGETGSGKSMLLDALHLILGDRADFSIIGPNGNKAIVEGKFIANEEIITWLELQEIDVEPQLIVRREITKEGKSRAFINDTPVSLVLQRDLSIRLFHIHSQFNTIELKDKRFQLELFDHLAGTHDQSILFQQQFIEFQKENNHLSSLKQSLFDAEKSIDYSIYLKEELAKLNLSSINYAELENVLRISENQSGLNECYANISALEEDGNLIDSLKRIEQLTEKWKTIDTHINELGLRIASVRLELKDIAASACSQLGVIELNASEINEITQKIDEFNRLLNKHKCKNQEELQRCFQELNEGADAIDELREHIIQLEKVVNNEKQRLQQVAQSLHAERDNARDEVMKKLKTLLTELNLPDTQLLIELSKATELERTGITKMEWMFSANVGYSPVSIEKAASGGELSRLMLALQKMLSEKKSLPTILFDEIDTGVSGEVAEKMGRFLKQMGKQRQIFAISHLPQVAAKANAHFYVKKFKEVNRAVTEIIEISDMERIEEIARLMSGEVITESARLTAKALMNDESVSY